MYDAMQTHILGFFFPSVNGIEFIKSVYFIYHVGVNQNSMIVF
jgi:hypothetical protein